MSTRPVASGQRPVAGKKRNLAFQLACAPTGISRENAEAMFHAVARGRFSDDTFEFFGTSTHEQARKHRRSFFVKRRVVMKDDQRRWLDGTASENDIVGVGKIEVSRQGM